MKKQGRPKSFRELSERAASKKEFFFLLRELLDAFYISGDKNSFLIERPLEFSDARLNAYLAASARQLCLDYGLEAPAWCRGIAHRLKKPWFPCELSSLRPWLIYSSPPAFKMLNVFPGENPLFRPLKIYDRDRINSRYMPAGVQDSG